VIKQLLKWFKGPTNVEAYENGRRCARVSLSKSLDKSAMADHLYDLSDGQFNNTRICKEFDQGLRDQLAELGYQPPYTNGQF
jgi:hypothetical protein